MQVATNSPINAGQTMGSASGVTSGSISFAADTENSLYSSGYHYTVTGPDGSTYSMLSSAVSANSSFDNTTNTGSIDGSAQSFVVNYTPDYQAAELQVDGSAVDSIQGHTGESMSSFSAVTDIDLIRTGSSYAVYYVTHLTGQVNHMLRYPRPWQIIQRLIIRPMVVVQIQTNKYSVFRTSH